MRTPLAAFLAIAVSCGGPSPSTETTTSTTAVAAPDVAGERAVAPPERERQPDLVEFHEWGLVDVDLAAGVAELSAGPGTPALPVVARKPVIYAHLAPGTDQASGELRVTLAGGTFLEHWPAGTIEEGTLRWPVAITRGACATRGPVRDLARACDTADGVCETGELPRYVTDDHDCIDVAGTQASLLFYRAQIPIAALPITLVRGPDLTLRATQAEVLPGGPRAMLRLSTGLSGPSPPGHVVVARAERAEGEVVIPVGTEAVDPAAERASMEQALVAQGLTASEARVFLDAWAGELFGATQASRGLPVEREARRRPIARPSQDVLLYWLAPAEVARIAPILSTIPSSERRAWLVRVGLGAVATAGPAAP